jgi:hypothetical protein
LDLGEALFDKGKVGIEELNGKAITYVFIEKVMTSFTWIELAISVMV